MRKPNPDVRRDMTAQIGLGIIGSMQLEPNTLWAALSAGVAATLTTLVTWWRAHRPSIRLEPGRFEITWRSDS
jgi:hypothetical protein